MSKAPSSLRLLGIVLVVGWIGAGGSAWADKPKIAVLGLEVAPGPTGAVEPATTQVAREITKELRARAQSGSSPYMIAPNSNKELTDEKLLLSCDNEGKECMAVIGAGLAADVLLFGRVEKRGDNYKVTLKLLDVKTKNVETRGDEMPVGGSVANISKRLYGKLIVDVGASTLNVFAHSDARSVDGGRVFIDEEKVGELASGKLTVGGISEGRHTVAIEAGGFRRFEDSVTVRAGQPAKLDALLLTRDEGGPVAHGGSHGKLWKIGLGTGIGLVAVGGALAIAGYIEQNDYFDTANSGLIPGAKQPTTSDCGNPPTDIKLDVKAFNSACSWHKVNIAGFVVAGVGGAVAVTSLIMLLLDHDHGSTERTASLGGKSSLVIVPVVSPEQTGAALSLRW